MLERVRETPEALLQELVVAARTLLARNLVVGSVGNISARVYQGFVITPTRMPYHEMRPKHLVFLDLGGTIIGSAPSPSREWRLHSAIYRARSDVSAVVHTHSLHATAWSFLPERLESRLEESAYYRIGPVSTSPPAPAGSRELGEAAVRALGNSQAALLGNHGVVAVGACLEEAMTVAEVVEREAQVAWLLRSAGAPPTDR